LIILNGVLRFSVDEEITIPFPGPGTQGWVI
jgi:hypothetical protein